MKKSFGARRTDELSVVTDSRMPCFQSSVVTNEESPRWYFSQASETQLFQPVLDPLLALLLVGRVWAYGASQNYPKCENLQLPKPRSLLIASVDLVKAIVASGGCSSPALLPLLHSVMRCDALLRYCVRLADLFFVAGFT